MSNKLYIVMPTYNEEANIKNVVEEWYPVLSLADEDSKLVIADGGSKDNTVKILRELQKVYPNLEVIEKPGTDHGTKVIFLYKYAIEQKADYIFQTDSDGQTKASEFNFFWENRNNYEAIIGNRVIRGDGFFRKIVERVLCILILLFFDVNIQDSNAPFRLMKADLVNKYINRLEPTFNLPNTMMTTYFVYYKHKVYFKEITFQPRQGGKNFMNLKRIVRIGFETIGNFAKYKKELKAYDNTKG